MDFEAACSVYIRFRGMNGYVEKAVVSDTLNSEPSAFRRFRVV